MAAVVALDRGGTLLCLPAEQQGEGSSGTMLGSGVWKARQPGRCRDVFGVATVALTLPSRPGQGCGCAQCPLQATGGKTAPEPTGRAHPSRGERHAAEAQWQPCGRIRIRRRGRYPAPLSRQRSRQRGPEQLSQARDQDQLVPSSLSRAAGRGLPPQVGRLCPTPQGA